MKRRVFIGRRVNATTPELAAEQFLVEIFDDGQGKASHRSSDDPSEGWSAPIIELSEVSSW